MTDGDPAEALVLRDRVDERVDHVTDDAEDVPGSCLREHVE
jgi:hypothetical protein